MPVPIFAGTGLGASSTNPQYDSTKFIKMGVKDGVTQYAHKSAENDMELHRLASGPVNGTWSQADVDKSTAFGGNPLGDGQVVGQAATGSWANRSTSQSNFAAMSIRAMEEIANSGGGSGGGGGNGTEGPNFTPETGYGGQFDGATPTGGDYLTPPPTNANVNQPLTSISQVMQNNSRVPDAAGATQTPGRTAAMTNGGLGRPTSSGGTGVSRTPANTNRNNTLSPAATGKLDQIKRVGIRF